MATDFNNELDTELTSETKLTIASGKIANFAYDSDAYDNDTVAGVEEYDYDNHQNIPLGDATILNTDSSILNKGVRSQASSLTRMMLNHFLGRSSFNVNKLADHLKNLLTTLKTFIQEGSNEWSPTILYKAGDVVYFMTTLNYEPCKRTFKCIVNCPSVNLPPVYTDGSLINTTYWKELSGRVAGLTVGATNSGKTNVATFNGSITVNGDITQSGTPYETHAEQIYTKKDNIITREDATGALPSGDYSGIKVNNYDGNGANGILAYRSDGTAVVGDEAGSPAVENLQPLLTRDEANNITNGAPLVWDATNKRAIGGSTSGVSVITTATTTVNNIPLSNNDSIQLLFTADISDTNATGGVTPLAITYNNVSVPLKVSKNGVLTDIFAHEILTNIWKYLQAYTVLDLIYLSDYDGNGNPAFIVKGNPILLSSSDYTIYANGYNEQEYVRNQNELSDMEVIRNGAGGTDIIDTSNYDGILYVMGRRSSGYGAVYSITLTIDSSTSHTLFGEIDGGHRESITYPFKKGDNLRTWVDSNGGTGSFVGVRYYKLRDYSDR